MSDEKSTKLVFRNAEERELWRDVVAHSGLDENGRCDEADAAVLAYRERCGPELESLFMGTPLSKLNAEEKQTLQRVLGLPSRDDARLAACWRELVDRLPNEAFADMGENEYPVDAIVRNFERLARGQPTRDEGPWGLWYQSIDDWDGYDGAITVFYSHTEAVNACQSDGIVAPFPRTRAEFERGPGAVDEVKAAGEPETRTIEVVPGSDEGFQVRCGEYVFYGDPPPAGCGAWDTDPGTEGYLEYPEAVLRASYLRATKNYPPIGGGA